MKNCLRCGAPIQPDDLFCGECGARQSGSGGPARESERAIQAVAPGSPIGQLLPGTMLQNRYEILNRIGGGGMGNVYQAYDQNLGHTFRAVKEMMEMYSDATQREKAVEDFRREAKLLAGLKHASIPTIYDHFIEGGRYYLVMEFIAGGDLATRQRQAGGKFDEATVTTWGLQICDVLDYLHHRTPPIIYRDLKPANLMIDPEMKRVMLIDFGIARIVAPTQRGVTAIGTMGYAPPELFSGHVDPRSDIYSLGSTMFHLLTGDDPRDKPLLIFDFTRNPMPRVVHPELSIEMEAILVRAVEYKPENRFPSAREMRQELEVHLRRLEEREPERTRTVRQSAFDDLSPEIQNEAVPEEAPLPQPTPASPAMERVFCCHCGISISVLDTFCAHCGGRQPTSLEWPRDSARLLVLDKETREIRGTFFLFKDSHLVGRTDAHSGIFPEIDLSAFDPLSKVSRRHARIWRTKEEFLLEDLNSANGTSVNDVEPVPPKQARPLRDGDILRVGDTRLIFREGA